MSEPITADTLRAALAELPPRDGIASEMAVGSKMVISALKYRIGTVPGAALFSIPIIVDPTMGLSSWELRNADGKVITQGNVG